jgi:hypothetical protein
MSESRVPAAAVAALAIIGGSTAANATTVINLSLSDLLTNGQSYNGSFDISSLLSKDLEVTSATLELDGYSDFGATGQVFTGSYAYAYTAYGVGYYSYSCGWGSTCYAAYYYSYPVYAPVYVTVDQVPDTLTLTSGADSAGGTDVGIGSPTSYYGTLLALLNLGSDSLNNANSTGIINFTGTASTNNDVLLTGATLSLNLEQVQSDVPSEGVPEPATWAMMLVGFGAIGAALRVQRRRASRVVVA